MAHYKSSVIVFYILILPAKPQQMSLLPGVVLFVVCFLLFCREVYLDGKRFAKKRQLDNEHILKEVARFLKEQAK